MSDSSIALSRSNPWALFDSDENSAKFDNLVSAIELRRYTVSFNNAHHREASLGQNNNYHYEPKQLVKCVLVGLHKFSQLLQCGDKSFFCFPGQQPFCLRNFVHQAVTCLSYFRAISCKFVMSRNALL